MSRQNDREQFLVHASQEGISLRDARLLLRQAATLHRLAEAVCNGDWPADNGGWPDKRIIRVCTECDTAWATASFRRGVCPDCRAEARVREILAAYPGVTPEFHGDPRGWVLLLRVPSGRTTDWGQRGIGVPS